MAGVFSMVTIGPLVRTMVPQTRPALALDSIAAGSGSWTPTLRMAARRIFHAGVALSDGSVLVVGGEGDLTSAERYVPSSGHWTPAGNLGTGRSYSKAARLADGRVLVVGGFVGGSSGTATAELYDAVSNSWSPASDMGTARSYGHSITVLSDGRVLVAGGVGVMAGGAEIYDPSANTWSPAASMLNQRAEHSATLLADGRVLVAGGAGGASGGGAGDVGEPTELYDPMSDTWTAAPPLVNGRSSHTATVLADGTVLVAGGRSGPATGIPQVEIFSPSSTTWSSAPPMAEARWGHSADVLLDGRVLVAGGYMRKASAELYDPTSGSWTSAFNMTAGRGHHVSARLPDGTVLVAGGCVADSEDCGGSSAERYDPEGVTILVGDSSVVEGNAGTTSAVFEVWLSDPSSGTITVHYTTRDYKARSPSDFMATSGTLTFLPGETRKTITVTVNGDTAHERNERYYLRLSAAVGASIGDLEAVGTILDDDGG